MSGPASTFRYEQIAHDRTCDAWSMDPSFAVFVEHGIEPSDGGDFERRADARGAMAHGRVDPVRQIGSIVVRDGLAIQPVLDRLRVAFPGVRWFSFERERCEASLRAA